MKYLDFERAGFNWPSAGDDRVLIKRPSAVPPLHPNCLCAPIPLIYPVFEDAVGHTVKDLAVEKGIADTVNTLQLEKLLDLQRAIELSRRSRLLWFCWGVALSPFLAKAFLWLSAL